MQPEYWTFKDEEVTWGGLLDLPVIKTLLLENGDNRINRTWKISTVHHHDGQKGRK